MPVAAEKLSALEQDLLVLPKEQQLHWFMLKAKVIVQQSDYIALEQLTANAKQLLNGDFPQSSYWNKLFQLNRLIIRKNGQALIRELSKLEQGVRDSANERLSAYYHRLLYQAYDIQDIWDLSLDNAVVNQREWQKLNGSYFALEAKIAIVDLSANLQGFTGAYMTLKKAQVAAEQLNLSNVMLELEVLAATVALGQKKPRSAVEILKALIVDKSIDPNHDLYVLVHHKLALVLLRLENFDEAIDLVNELSESEKVKDPATRVSLDLILAKSLV